VSELTLLRLRNGLLEEQLGAGSRLRARELLALFLRLSFSTPSRPLGFLILDYVNLIITKAAISSQLVRQHHHGSRGTLGELLVPLYAPFILLATRSTASLLQLLVLENFPTSHIHGRRTQPCASRLRRLDWKFSSPVGSSPRTRKSAP